MFSAQRDEKKQGIRSYTHRRQKLSFPFQKLFNSCKYNPVSFHSVRVQAKIKVLDVDHSVKENFKYLGILVSD